MEQELHFSLPRQQPSAAHHTYHDLHSQTKECQLFTENIKGFTRKKTGHGCSNSPHVDCYCLLPNKKKNVLGSSKIDGWVWEILHLKCLCKELSAAAVAAPSLEVPKASLNGTWSNLGYIFTLTLMCTERYLAVTRPLDTLKRSRGYRKVTAGAVWSVSLLLTLPMMLMVTLTEGGKAEGKVKRMCAPTWSVDAYRTYLTVLFSTSIMAPGIIIGFLYTRLARTYLESQRNPPHKEKSKRSPRQKVLIMIFSIVLVFWACFLPFWIWQLVRLYSSSLHLTTQTQKCINYLVTCLTYSNSCINPFLYTLLTKNYREYLRNRHRNFYRFTSSFRKRGSNLQCSWGRSMSSSNQYDYSSEALGMATLKDK
uniref:Urotensin-2 receptor n=6 Tax=Neoaves TaxID=3078114 RepID=A0A8D2MQG4_ZONAL